MISFVNAKINIGLAVTERRSDGYHNLETVFYPVGKKSGLPGEPASFGDMLEIVPSEKLELILTGNNIDCKKEKNLVWRAAELYRMELEKKYPGKWYNFEIILDKHIPDGAGLGGGSADASFTLRCLNDVFGAFTVEELSKMAFRLGADCPFFIYNEPMYGWGAGENLMPLPVDLSGMWLLTVKKDVYVSTRDAFSGITPKASEFDLRCLPELPIEDWKKYVKNDFETTVFEKYPALSLLKEEIYGTGAVYSSMTGSGSVIYGIFKNVKEGEKAFEYFRNDSTNVHVGLLSL